MPSFSFLSFSFSVLFLCRPFPLPSFSFLSFSFAVLFLCPSPSLCSSLSLCPTFSDRSDARFRMPARRSASFRAYKEGKGSNCLCPLCFAFCPYFFPETLALRSNAAARHPFETLPKTVSRPREAKNFASARLPNIRPAASAASLPSLPAPTHILLSEYPF